FTGGAGANTFYLRLDPTGTNVEISQSSGPLSPPTYTAPLASLPALTFTTAGVSDALRVDLANGPPLPAPGISYTGSGAALVAVTGSAVPDSVGISSSSVTINS